MRRVTALLLICVVFSCSFSASAREDIPAPDLLKDWQQWILSQDKWLSCAPRLGQAWNQAGGRLCLWSGPMQLALDDDRGRFSVVVTVYAESNVALPGSQEHWPQQVTVNGAAAPVIRIKNRPAVLLEAGEYRIQGEFRWHQIPSFIPLPAHYGIIGLSLGGSPVRLPDIREGRLWLATTEEQEQQSDSIYIQASRRLIDSVPSTLETVLEIQVGGRAREVQIPNVLLAGYRPVSLQVHEASDYRSPLQLQADGGLTLQARSGFVLVRLLALADNVVSQVTAPQPTPASDGTELWAFDARPLIRVAVAEGHQPTDARQAPSAMAAEWQHLPLFALGSGQSLNVIERSRGMRPDEGNRLRLNRTWWLNFDGDGFHLEDRINGQMRHGWRLDLKPPYRLESAYGDYRNEPIMITASEDGSTAGVEVRNPALRLTASASGPNSGRLPVSGWSESLEQADARLILPPGWRLWAAPGAERASDTWWDAWRLLDMFLVLITGAFVYRLLGWRGALLSVLFLALNYHIAKPLFAPLLTVILLTLAVRALPGGLLRRFCTLIRNLAGIALFGVALLFIAEQAKLALYPQLEYGQLYGAYRSSGPPAATAAREAFEQGEALARSVMEEPPVEDEFSKTTVTGSRVSYHNLLNRYPESALLQAGSGRPQWSWRQHYLHWSGPVTPDQTFRLIVSPPWLTGAIRWLSIALLAWLLYALYRQLPAERRSQSPAGRSQVSILVLLAAACCVPVSVQADIPSPELLDDYRNRLHTPPVCANQCATLADARLAVGAERLALELQWHVAEPVAVPLPQAEQGRWRIVSLTVNDREDQKLSGLEAPTLWLPRGIHTVRVGGEIKSVDGFDIRFPAIPQVIGVSSEHWIFSGLNQGRLLSNTLKLSRRATAGSGERSDVRGSLQLPAFARLERRFLLDREWELQSSLSRWSEASADATFEIPLILGEQVSSPETLVEDGRVIVHLRAGEDPAGGDPSWVSRLTPDAEFQLSAAAFEDYAESWVFTVSPIWHLEFDGIAEVLPEHIGDFWRYTFYPRPEETLTVRATRPAAVAGNTLVFDRVQIDDQLGKHQRTVVLTATARNTLGQEHEILLPADATLRSLQVDGEQHYLTPRDGKLSLSLNPGEHTLRMELTRPEGIGPTVSGSVFDLNADSANLRRQLQLPANRWILAVWGPGVGPAVLYWSVLAVVVLLAWVLSRTGLTPLRFYHWLLLGLGFSLFAWPVLAIAVLWLLLTGWIGRQSPPASRTNYNLRQIGFVMFSLFALLALIAAIPWSLLSEPDMQIAGAGSYGRRLIWIMDRTGGEFPAHHAFSLPLWAYQILILLWALWLSLALVRWIRWAWNVLSAHGLWRPKATPES